jgi:YfiH family protein
MITISTLNDLHRIRHAFFTREGGVSEGIYASLNCGFGSNDDPAKVRKNRALAMERLELKPEALVTVFQEHTANAVIVDRPFAHDQAPVADAMVTDRPGIALGILTADCAPVLLADAKAKVIGAAHAGWRGAFHGILEATVEKMVELGAKPAHIVAAVGPCIARRSYEVGPEFPAPFLEADPDNAFFFHDSPREGRFMFDLAGYASRRLLNLGVPDVCTTPCDTSLEAGRFFSYRRSMALKEPDYGRQLSAIVIEP